MLSLIKEFLKEIRLQSLSGGVHASALCDPERVLVVAEDIGGHSTLDKIQGECMLKGIATKDRLLLAAARFSPQMLLNAARMGIPVVVSRHLPPLSSTSLAGDLGITLGRPSLGRSSSGIHSCGTHFGRRGEWRWESSLRSKGDGEMSWL